MPMQEYQIVSKMATGSFGIVFKVRRVTDDRLFVMKRIPLADLSSFQRHDAAQEITLMKELHHPCVVGQQDVFLFNEDDLCLVMEYYDGGDLDSFVCAQREKDVYLEFRRVMLWFVQLVLGTQYLHARQVLHRDIKTHNLFLRKKDGTVALGDFGISEKVEGSAAARTWAGSRRAVLHHQRGVSAFETRSPLLSPSPTRQEDLASGSPHTSSPLSGGGMGTAGLGEAHQPGSWTTSPLDVGGAGDVPSPMQGGPFSALSPLRPSQQRRRAEGSPLSGSQPGPSDMVAAVKGTPLYMAPEVLQGGAASLASDVWSLGCVLYELLALRHPFECRDIASLVMHVSRGQRSPLPSHYPRCVHELIDSMLELDKTKRPSCEAILATPCVKVYADLWRLTRTPLDVPSAPSEVSLAKQFAALEKHVFSSDQLSDADEAKQRQRRDNTTPVLQHFSDVEALLEKPTCSPQEARDALDEEERQKAQEAAAAMYRRAENRLERQGSGNTSLQGDNTYVLEHDDSSAGTFFVGDGRTPAAIFGGEDHNSFCSHGITPRSDWAGGMQPSASLVPHMIYDVAPPTEGRRGSGNAAPGRPPLGTRRPASGPSRGGGGLSPGALAAAAAYPASVALHADSPDARAASPSLTSPPHDARGPPADRNPSPALQHRGGPSPRMEPPETLRPTPNKKKAPRRVASESPGVVPAPPPLLGDPVEDTFFQIYDNVADMRDASVSTLEAEVTRLHRVLQDQIRQQRLLDDAAQLHTRHGSQLLRSMPNLLKLIATAANGDDAEEQGERDSVDARESHPTSVPPLSSAASARPARQQQRLPSMGSSSSGSYPTATPQQMQALLDHFHDERGSGSDLVGARQGSGRPSLLSLSVPSPSSSSSPSSPYHYVPPTSYQISSSSTRRTSLEEAPPAKRNSQFHKEEKMTSPSFRPYLARREGLVRRLCAAIGEKLLERVYEYYAQTPLLSRDAGMVRRMVPEREMWVALPIVEELVVLDRTLRRIETAD